MTNKLSIRLKDEALRLAFEKEVARQRFRSNLALSRDIGVAVLILGGIGGFLSVASYALNLFNLR